MKSKWESLKKILGGELKGICANQLHAQQNKTDFIFNTVEPVLYIKNNGLITYWKVDWGETMEADDYLLLNEQSTPEPVEYETKENSHYRHILGGSGIEVQQKTIQNISGYGFKDRDDTFLTTLLLELEEVYICIKAGPVLQIVISNEACDELPDVIFST
ncbi:hypothetical protein [Gracilibacillus salinarum]|uniref:Uncharacterized protein n=1 Tax=Gracilibacillus salinarum TaxID=2932255 RepID=A0ABY4GJI7_9BACI|nr:hypothetical protein [Gracilibacillus salinarum]UOQ84391.1 hypothetical protein MUN87_17100 [Gracilibacillus salinarum]